MNTVPAILYEDEHLLIVDKPAGMVVHPTYRHSSGTLLDAIRSYGIDWPAAQAPSIVGRLDKLASGIVVAAKSGAAHALLQRALAHPDCEKDYLAIVHGTAPTNGTIDLKLRIDPDDRRRAIGSTELGRDSITSYERLACSDGLSLLRCRIATGRRHQIRVHLAASGWPIVGDRLYGAPACSVTRVALHAWRVAFRHPIERAPMAVTCPIPDDLRSVVERSHLGHDPLA